MTRRSFRLLSAVFAAVLLASVAVGSASAHGPSSARRDLIRAAAATARFHSLRQAAKAGYAAFPEGAPLHECISNLTGPGAMGFHWLKADLLTTDLDPTRPQVLVYAPDRHGGLHLVALEFVVFKDAWDAAHPGTMPMLFGEEFMETGFPNRYDIPAFYALHVWLFRYNPAGLFAPFNPRVSCDPGHKAKPDLHVRAVTGAPVAVFECTMPFRSTSRVSTRVS